jgi:hypothetical protein
MVRLHSGEKGILEGVWARSSPLPRVFDHLHQNLPRFLHTFHLLGERDASALNAITLSESHVKTQAVHRGHYGFLGVYCGENPD